MLSDRDRAGNMGNNTYIHKVNPIWLSLYLSPTGTQCTWSLPPHGCNDTLQVSDSRVQQKQQCVCAAHCVAMSINRDDAKPNREGLDWIYGLVRLQPGS